MKKLVLVAVFAIIGLGLNAQDTKVVKEEFYANGNLKAQFMEVNESLIQATYFFETGTINEIGFFEEDELSGQWKTYNSNSELLAIGYFTDNRKSGTWSFYQNGSKIQEVTYSGSQIAKN
ncbi:MAG: antitoxin component YwqK of YwqJK toxin-antitoxin module [Salibacteraceae bacterium]|jgi:antitoxin component YwqK of YwqJK toxin-antitoxin module